VTQACKDCGAVLSVNLFGEHEPCAACVAEEIVLAPVSTNVAPPTREREYFIVRESPLAVLVLNRDSFPVKKV
jgi:hypothetical protein